MSKKTSIASRFVRVGKRLVVIVGLVGALALPMTASASTHAAPVTAHHAFRPADGVGDSPLVP